MFKIIAMRGISGSGKSSYVKRMSEDESGSVKNTICVISSDAIRQELTGDISCQSKNAEVFQMMESRLREAIASDEFVKIYVDATHLTKSSFDYIIRVLNDYSVPVNDVLIIQHDVSVEDAIARVQKRAESGGLNVPAYAIKRQFNNLNSSQAYFDSLHYPISHFY